MHITYALDVLKKMYHKAESAEEKEALFVAISNVEKKIAERKRVQNAS